MTAKNWKRLHPTSLIHALRISKDYAREVNHRSVERIADLMAVTPDLLYKWLANGRMPAVLIPTFEHACGIDFVSRWLALSAGKLVVEIPTGRDLKECDLHQLQELLHAAVGKLMEFADGRGEAVPTLGALDSAMSGLAFHRGNVAKHAQPELEFMSPAPAAAGTASAAGGGER
jgi:hypothetical protein